MSRLPPLNIKAHLLVSISIPRCLTATFACDQSIESQPHFEIGITLNSILELCELGRLALLTGTFISIELLNLAGIVRQS